MFLGESGLGGRSRCVFLTNRLHLGFGQDSGAAALATIRGAMPHLVSFILPFCSPTEI